jgi:hypothetical protein
VKSQLRACAGNGRITSRCWLTSCEAQKNYDIVNSFADILSAAPRTFHMRHDGRDFAVFCFAKAEDAGSSCDRFSGERLPWRGNDGT